MQRLRVIDRIRFDRLCVINRRARVSKGRVHRMRECVNFRGLLFTGEHERRTAILCKSFATASANLSAKIERPDFCELD